MAEKASDPGADEVIARYGQALDALDGGQGGAQALLAALVERDRVGALLAGGQRDPERIGRLAALDGRLRLAAARVKGADWPGWRGAAHPGSASWWWSLDQALAQEAGQRNTLWLFFAGILMTATLGLGADISLKLWGSGAGALSFVSGLLTLLLTGGPLTARGRELAAWLIDRLRLPARFRGGWVFGAALAFFLVTLLLRLVALPAWARVYNDRGVELLQAGDLAGAQRALDRAVSINPQYAQGYYNLGSAYLGVGDHDQAVSLFRRALAVDRGLDLAYSGLGYALLLQGTPDKAIPVLYSGLAVAQDDAARIALYTNLGQAYLAAGRPLEAESALKSALALDPREAVAYCTLGRVAEVLGRQPGEASLHWESCLSFADPTTPRGREMADMARAHLLQSGGGE